MKPQHFENIDQRDPEEIVNTEQSFSFTRSKKAGEDVMRLLSKDQRDPEEIATKTLTNTLYS